MFILQKTLWKAKNDCLIVFLEDRPVTQWFIVEAGWRAQRSRASSTGPCTGFRGHIAAPPIILLFLQRDGPLRHSHVLVKSIVAHPSDSFYCRTQFEDPEVLHVVLPIACHCFRVYPHTCREPWSQFSCSPSSSSHPPTLSITAMELESSAFVWMAFSRSNLSSTKDCQNCFTTYSLVNLALALNSANYLSLSFNLFSWALSRRLVTQDETSNRHQCWSDYLTRKGEC